MSYTGYESYPMKDLLKALHRAPSCPGEMRETLNRLENLPFDIDNPMLAFALDALDTNDELTSDLMELRDAFDDQSGQLQDLTEILKELQDVVASPVVGDKNKIHQVASTLNSILEPKL